MAAVPLLELPAGAVDGHQGIRGKFIEHFSQQETSKDALA